jgi:hypothetical protein
MNCDNFHQATAVPPCSEAIRDWAMRLRFPEEDAHESEPDGFDNGRDRRSVFQAW